MPTVEAASTTPAELLRTPESRYWLNLAAAGLVVFYVIYVGWQLASHMMCSQIGVDYCDSLRAGIVANLHGYAGVYDFGLLQQAQRLMLSTAADAAVPVVPFRYLPILVLPFQLLARLNPTIGFWLWTAVNGVGLLLYAKAFLHRLGLPPASPRIMLLLCLSLPVFMNLFLGQVNLLLVICVGEFMIAWLHGRFFVAGLWLAGLLLKPQLLVLMGLVLLVQRAWRILAGVAASSAGLGLISVLMIGPAGLRGMLGTWLSAVGEGDNTWVQGMMNWRMVGTHLAGWIGPWAGWAVAIAGMLATLTIMLVAWRRGADADSPKFAVALTGVLAACSSLAWHSHIHMAVVLLPPLLYLYQAGLLPQKLLDYWVFVPALIFVAMVFVPETLMALQLVPTTIQPLIYFVLGTGELSASLYVFAWAVRASHEQPSAV